MSVFILDGVDYSDIVVIESIKETVDILDGDNAGRVIKDGEMKLDTIGSFISHDIIFSRKNDNLGMYDKLFDTCNSILKRTHTVKIIHNQSHIEYLAYCKTNGRDLEYIDNCGHHWGSVNIKFIPIKANGAVI